MCAAERASKADQTGGGQENNLRSGTTNVPSIMALDVSAKLWTDNRTERLENMTRVKHRLYSNLSRIKDIKLNGPEINDSVPYILNISFLGVRGEVLRLHNGQRPACFNRLSCAARNRGKNRILTAMGITGDRQDGAIRFSFGAGNTEAEADAAAQMIEDSLSLLRRFRRR